jgi:dihydrofolate reductase
MTLVDVGPDNWRHCAALEVEMTLLICPVVVGQGTRLFPDTGPDTALDLVLSRSTPSGVTIQVYRPTGHPQYETATPDRAPNVGTALDD